MIHETNGRQMERERRTREADAKNIVITRFIQSL